MDSQNIFISSNVYSRKIIWIGNETESHWNYLGGDIIKMVLLIESILEKEYTPYLITNRHNTFLFEKEIVTVLSNELLKKEAFIIWDNLFEKVIEFNKNDVYRFGKETG